MTLIAFLIRGILRLILSTCRFNLKGQENLISHDHRSNIIMLWHNRLLLIGPALLKCKSMRRFVAFISKSKDGDPVAEYVKSYPQGDVIRVPHDSRDQALKSLINRLKYSKDVAIVTPDGPRGPKYRVKQGVALAAKTTGAVIIPFSWQASSYWEVNSWDRFRIPKPFSRIEAIFGEPLTLSEEEPLEESNLKLQKALDAIS